MTRRVAKNITIRYIKQLFVYFTIAVLNFAGLIELRLWSRLKFFHQLDM